jgi:beta-phosphoglucomutase-like phosphatase (HAD superfamily)
VKPFPAGGAIFDLDGVLVDTACDHFEAWQQMARSLGFELSPAQGERLKGDVDLSLLFGPDKEATSSAARVGRSDSLGGR